MTRISRIFFFTILCLQFAACDLFEKEDPLKKVQGMSVFSASGEVVRVIQNKASSKFTIPLDASNSYSISWLNVQEKNIILADLKGKTLAFEVADATIAEVALVESYAFSIKAKKAATTTVIFKLMEKNTVVFQSPKIDIAVKG